MRASYFKDKVIDLNDRSFEMWVDRTEKVDQLIEKVKNVERLVQDNIESKKNKIKELTRMS